MALLLSAAGVRSWINDLIMGADLSPTAATNAAPAVITAAGHGLTSGDVMAQWGFTTNTAVNGVFWVTVVNANTYKLSTSFANFQAGTFVAGNGATGAGHAVRVTIGLTPHDLKNMQRTLGSVSYVRDSDATFSTSPRESTIQTIFGQ